MNSLRPFWVATVLAVGTVAGFTVQLITSANGYAVPILHWTSLLTMGAATVLTLVMGIRIKRYTSGKATSPINPIAAARTLVLAQASVYAGSTIAGWHAGILIGLLGASGSGSTAVKSSLVMIGGALVMAIVGWVVEQFCKLPPEEPTSPEGHAKGKDEEGYAAGTN